MANLTKEKIEETTALQLEEVDVTNYIDDADNFNAMLDQCGMTVVEWVQACNALEWKNEIENKIASVEA